MSGGSTWEPSRRRSPARSDWFSTSDLPRETVMARLLGWAGRHLGQARVQTELVRRVRVEAGLADGIDTVQVELGSQGDITTVDIYLVKSDAPSACAAVTLNPRRVHGPGPAAGPIRAVIARAPGLNRSGFGRELRCWL